MAELIREFPAYEPLRSNRWLVRMSGCNVLEKGVPEWSFKSFKIYNDKNQKMLEYDRDFLKLELEIRNSTGFLLTPDMVMDEKKIDIEFLDPVGEVIDKYSMEVNFDNFLLSGDYGDDDILTHKLIFDIKSISSLQTEVIDKQALENYKKNKEKNTEKV
jgi:hypothetical protein